MSTWYKDQQGREFTTVDGKPPSTVNMPVTVNDGTGRIGNGSWTGTAANPTPPAKSS